MLHASCMCPNFVLPTSDDVATFGRSSVRVGICLRLTCGLALTEALAA